MNPDSICSVAEASFSLEAKCLLDITREILFITFRALFFAQYCEQCFCKYIKHKRQKYIDSCICLLVENAKYTYYDFRHG